MIPVKIPWEIIGPAAAAAIIILIIVFYFILKWKKLERKDSGPPVDLNTMSKKSLCFKHEGRISSNETAVNMIGAQFETFNENNRQDHGKIFDKIEKLGTSIIKEIHKSNDK